MTSARQIFLGRGAGGIKRINSVKSDGVAYTACAHVFQSTTALRLRISLSGASDMTLSDIRGKNCFGGSLNDGDFLMNNYNDGLALGSLDFQIYSGSGHVGSLRKWETIADGNFHEVILEKNGSYFSVYFDGYGEILNKYVSGTPTHGRVCVFTQNAATGYNVVPMSNRVPKKVSISAFQMWEDGDLVSDLIPAIAPDGEICFYDAVAGEYARNLAGIGSFSEGA